MLLLAKGALNWTNHNYIWNTYSRRNKITYLLMLSSFHKIFFKIRIDATTLVCSLLFMPASVLLRALQRMRTRFERKRKSRAYLSLSRARAGARISSAFYLWTAHALDFFFTYFLERDFGWHHDARLKILWFIISNTVLWIVFKCFSGWIFTLLCRFILKVPEYFQMKEKYISKY